MAKDGQDFDMYQGEDKIIRITVVDKDGNPFDLTNAEITWEVQRDLLSGSGSDLMKDTNSGIAITDPTNGIFEVTLKPADTEDLHGNYYHEARVTDQQSQKATVLTGTANIMSTAIG